MRETVCTSEADHSQKTFRLYRVVRLDTIVELCMLSGHVARFVFFSKGRISR